MEDRVDAVMTDHVVATDIDDEYNATGIDKLSNNPRISATSFLPVESQGDASTTVSGLADLKPTETFHKSFPERYSSLDPSNLETLLSGGLDRFYGKFKNEWKKNNLSFPTPEVHFQNLSYTVWLSNETPASKSSIGGYLRGVIEPWRKLKTVKKVILHPMTGSISPGTMTLILANPGAGKSTFLKALAGKLSSRKGQRSFKGNVTYSGLAAEEITISKLVGLVDQQDNHFPTLTVRETIEFADRCLNGPPENQPPTLREVARLRTDLCLHILGLTKCADTCVGDALLRGVSGGERKRVTIGEMLVGGQSVFLCDEISTGLDSAATFDIVKSLKSWTRTLGGSAVVALLQPPPEVVDLFDDILILSEGRLVYHGPRVEMLPYFSRLGFERPEQSVDPAEFVLDVVSGRGAQFLVKQNRAQAILSNPPRQPVQFEEYFQKSEIYKNTISRMEEQNRNCRKIQNEDEMQGVAHLIGMNTGSSSQYKIGFFGSLTLLLDRQKKIWMRDRALVLGKLVEAVLVGLLLGVIYFNVTRTLYLRMLFFCVAIFQRQAWQQLTISFQVRNIFYKQRSRNFFRTLVYTLAESIVQVPLNLCVSFTLVVIFYFMSGLSKTGSTFIVFYIIIVCFQHAISAYFSLVASICPTVTVAQALASLSVSFFLLFSGNIILPDLIPDYWIWLYWYNPVAWTLRALLLNEFYDHRYTEEIRKKSLARVQVSKGPEFIWIAIIVLIAYYVIFTLLNTAVLRFIHYETTSTASSVLGITEDSYTTEEKTIQIGSSDDVTPQPQSHHEQHDTADVVVQVPPGGNNNNDATSNDEPTFIRAYLAVRDLDYFVQNPAGKGELQLLHGITASFIPGKMSALMGSSGAGKTTFMDVLAGRKTGGRTAGEILVNGEPKDPSTFSRIAGYCEQMDIHSGGATILEALQFSARLRLPQETTREEQDAIVQNTMELLELNGIARELVRNCSIEQKKRITIGVEVVANPSILFLDEPTSGLDARSASTVMKGVQSIARTGRTVVCTIHQPSKQIFELFDSLLLLQKGGHIAFFGDLGNGSEKLLQYFAGIPGTPPFQTSMNPATYMLEVIGAGIARGNTRDYSLEYTKSAIYQTNKEIADRVATGQICEESNTDKPQQSIIPFSTLKLTPIATNFFTQFICCARKMRLTYWRNPQYNFMRMVAYPIYAVIFGSAFYKLTEGTISAVNSHIGLMYNTLDFIGVINMMTVLDTVCTERAVYYRERMSNYYGPLPYALSLFLAELPYLVLVSFLFVNVEYWMIGWEADARSFFLFWFVFFLHVSICTTVGQFMAVLMPNIKVGNVAVGALSVFFNLFSGFLMPHDSMRGFYSWIRYLVITNYSLESLAAIEMGQCHIGGNSHGCIMVKDTIADQDKSLKTYIDDYYDFHYDHIKENIGILLGMAGIIQICIYLTLRFVSHLKR